MIWVVLVVGILILALGAWLAYEDAIGFDLIVGVTGLLMTIGALVAAGVLFSRLSSMMVIDEKIAMYSEENAKIETQLAEAVEQYRAYETNVFQSVAPESAVTLVTLYPELKADTLVQAQMDVYVANNAQIKELKVSKLNEPIYRWWLYFGR